MRQAAREVQVIHKSPETEKKEDLVPLGTKEGVVRSFQGPFGFIVDEVGTDYFCHFTGIRSTGLRNLAKGQRVRFEAFVGPKGHCARDVIVLNA